MTRVSSLSAAALESSAPSALGGGAAVFCTQTKTRRITSVTLHEFRSYRHLLLERDLLAQARTIVLTGDNGVGKTNLLEAISMLSPGRGLRRAPLQQLARRQDADGGNKGWSVQAAILDDIGEMRVATALPAPNGGRGARGRSLRIDGAPAESLTRLAHVAPMLWLTPALERAIAESASARRRFLDRIVMSLEPDHGARCIAYERAMRERNRLLQESGNAVWLESLEKIMAQEGTSMAAARRRVVALLGEVLEEQSLPAFPRARIAVAFPDVPQGGQDSCGEQTSPHNHVSLEEEQRLRSCLREMRLLDRRAGRALAGPHRCDLHIRRQGRQGDMPLESCSSGEQKALLLALILAHGRLLSASPRGAPILLLDEVAAHLDAARRRALFDILAQSGAHSWMTGVTPSLFDGCQEDSCFLSVSSAGVVPTEGAPRTRSYPARQIH